MAERLNLMGGLRPAGVPPLALLSLVLVVAMVHGCVVQQLSRNLSEFHADRAMPARIEVAYVRDMAMAPPPAVAPMAAPAPVAAAQRGAAPKVECRNVGVAPAQLIIWHRRVMTALGDLQKLFRKKPSGSIARARPKSCWTEPDTGSRSGRGSSTPIGNWTIATLIGHQSARQWPC